MVAGQVKLVTIADYLSGNFCIGIVKVRHISPHHSITFFYVLCARVRICECRHTCTMERI